MPIQKQNKRKLRKGVTKTVKGRTYKLGKTSRWERMSTSAKLATVSGSLLAVTGLTVLYAKKGGKIFSGLASKSAMRDVFKNMGKGGKPSVKAVVGNLRKNVVRGKDMGDQSSYASHTTKLLMKLSRITRKRKSNLYSSAVATGYVGVVTGYASLRYPRKSK